MRTELADAWVPFLERFGPYDWFTTHTWPKPTGAERRRKDFNYWIRELNRRQDGLGLGRWWHREPGRARFVLAWEPHRSGAIHCHALVAAPYLLQVGRVRWKEKWHEFTGGQARVYATESQSAVRTYCSKSYVAKDGELELSPNIAELLPTVRARLLAKGWSSLSGVVLCSSSSWARPHVAAPHPGELRRRA